MSGLHHYKFIDALRGFAFLGVLTIHASQQCELAIGGGIAEVGQYGVQLFFLLSAVTLLRSATLRSGEHFAQRNFLIRRFFRIAPLFWFAIALYFLINGCRPRHWAPDGLTGWHFLSTVLFLHGWSLTTINSAVPGDWSIAAEMTFYLCLPFMAARITSVRSALYAALCALVASMILNALLLPILLHTVPPGQKYLVDGFLYWWFPSQVPVFLLGFALYHHLQDSARAKLVSGFLHPVWVTIAALGVLIVVGRFPNKPLAPVYILCTAAFIPVIMSWAERPFGLAVNPLTCGLGVISFSCYITHFAILGVALRLLPIRYFAHFSTTLASELHFVVVWLAALVLTAMASTVTYLIIEKPGMKLGSRIIRAYEAQHSRPVRSL